MTIESFINFFKISLQGGVNYIQKGTTTVHRGPDTGGKIRIAYGQIFYEFNFAEVSSPIFANENALIEWYMINNIPQLETIPADVLIFSGILDDGGPYVNSLVDPNPVPE